MLKVCKLFCGGAAAVHVSHLSARCPGGFERAAVLALIIQKKGCTALLTALTKPSLGWWIYTAILSCQVGNSNSHLSAAG